MINRLEYLPDPQLTQTDRICLAVTLGVPVPMSNDHAAGLWLSARLSLRLMPMGQRWAGRLELLCEAGDNDGNGAYFHTESGADVFFLQMDQFGP